MEDTSVFVALPTVIIRAGKNQVCVQKWFKFDIKTNWYPSVPGATAHLTITVRQTRLLHRYDLPSFRYDLPV